MEPVSLQASRYATTSLPPILGRVIFPDGPTFTEARSGGRRVVSAFEKSARQPTLQAWRLAPRVGIGLILTPMRVPWVRLPSSRRYLRTVQLAVADCAGSLSDCAFNVMVLGAPAAYTGIG